MKHLITYLLVSTQLLKGQPPLNFASPHPFYTLPGDSGLASVPGFPEGTCQSAGLCAEQKFGLKELTLLALDLYCPFEHSALYMRAKTFGYPTYRQSGILIGYARVFSNLRAQAGFNLNRFKARNSPATHSVSGKLSLLWRKKPWWVAADLDHFISFSTSLHQPDIDMMVLLGYQLSEQLNANITFQKNSRIFFSLLYAPTERIQLKAGISGRPAQVSGMTGFRFGKLQLQLINDYHPVLGMSTALAIVSNW